MAAADVREHVGLSIPPDVRSIHRLDQQQVRVRFYNLTQRNADVIWIDQQGRPVKYASLRHRQYIDLDTFVGHPWIFRENETGAPLFTHTKSNVFWPHASGNPAVVSRYSVGITIGDVTLLDICVRAVAKQLPSAGDVHMEINNLPIPTTIKDEVRSFASRSRRYNAFEVPALQNRNHVNNQS